MAKKQRSVSSAFVTGLFVLTGAIVVVATIIWLGANQFLKEQVFYVTYFESSVEGMEKGSAVKYQGVPCGRIADIRVAPDGRLVEVVMQLDPNIKISDSMRINPAMSGIAGGKFLQLHFPSADMANRNPELSFKPQFPLIKSSPSSLEEISIAAQKVFNNLMDLQVGEISMESLKFLSTTTAFFQSDTLKTILNNLMSATQRLDGILAQADTSSVIRNLEYTSMSLYESSLELKATSQNLNSQITNMKLPYYLERAYNQYDSTLINTNKLMNNVGYRAESALLNLQETFDELKKTNKALQNSLNAISDNPSAVFFSNPPQKEK